MVRDRLRRPVVVAVADADPTDDAVEWAAAEAAARAAPLVVVHVVRTTPMWDAGVLVPLPVGCWAVQPSGREVLAVAVERARAVAAEVVPTGRLLCGAPVRALLEQSRDAGLLVLGGSGAAVCRCSAWSLSARVAARASCPVAVVRSRPRVRTGAARPRVVVGVGTARCAPATLEFAFRAAGRRGVPLLAVHAWDGDAPADLEGVCGPPSLGEAAAGDALDRTLGPWRRRFPEIPVEPRLVRADPVTALLAESAGAALVVVGSRGRLPVPFGGSVGRALLQRSAAPAVVVRTDRAGRVDAGTSRPAGGVAAPPTSAAG